MKLLLKKKDELKELYDKAINQLDLLNKEAIALVGAIKAVEELIAENENEDDGDG
tara:strand:+ start:143 stop:307 length:165 start_codon:yes stop_codon:yes gene_type:complete